MRWYEIQSYRSLDGQKVESEHRPGYPLLRYGANCTRFSAACFHGDGHA